MATYRLRSGIRLVLAFAFVSSFVAGQDSGWAWDVNPDPPQANTPIIVIMTTAPCYPVSVQLTVNGVAGPILEIDAPGGDCEFPNSGSTSGQSWSIKCWCGSSSSRKVGTF